MTDLYIHLFHGRKTPDEELDDWGSDGPVIGPLRYVHGTYMSTLRVGCKRDVLARFFPEEEARVAKHITDYPDTSAYRDDDEILDVFFPFHEDLLVHDGVYYGDWSVGGSELKAVDFNA